MSVQTRIATSVFCAFSVFICGLFTISLALGVYVFYASDIGGGINYEYPINSVIGMYDGEPISAINGITIGHIFAIMWALTVGMFAISIKGSKIGYFHALEKMRDGIKAHTIYNHMFQATRWFSILILVSVVIVVIQGLLGVEVVPPEIKNDLVGFYQISNAPYIEEVMFRILLIGIPLYLIYSHKASGSHFLKSLWHPDVHLHIERKTSRTSSKFHVAYDQDGYSIGLLGITRGRCILVGFILLERFASKSGSKYGKTLARFRAGAHIG